MANAFTTASLSPSERDAVRALVAGSPLELEVHFRKSIEVEPVTRDGLTVVNGRTVTNGQTPEFTGRIQYDSWHHPDDPWIWTVTDRTIVSDESGIAQYGTSDSTGRFVSQLAALEDLLRYLAVR